MSSPEKFSTSALIRPLIQDALFPTVACILGPAELAYQCQIGSLYETFGVRRPALVNRHMACVLDPRADRNLSKVDQPAEWFFKHWEEVEREAASELT